MVIKDQAVYWTTYSKEGEVLEPWPVRLTVRHYGSSTEYIFRMVDPKNTKELLRTTVSKQFLPPIMMKDLNFITLFETREAAIEAYPSLKLLEIQKGMEKTKLQLAQLTAWLKKQGTK